MSDVRYAPGVPLAASFAGIGAPTQCAPILVDSSTGIVYTLKTGDIVVAAGAGGTVTSVGLSLPSIFSVSGSPVTTSGTLTGSLATQNANRVFSGPTTGAAATPTFRGLVNADLPATAVTPGSYTYASFTVNQQGVLTAASSGTTAVTSVTGTAPIASTGGTTPVISLNDTAVTPGSYTNASLTVDQKGRLTAASSGAAPVTSVGATAPITSSGGATPTIGVTAAALTRTNDTNVTLTLGGTPTSSLLAATSLTLGWTGQLSETRGGTAQSTYTTGDLLQATASNTLGKLAAVATGNALISGGIGTASSWGKIGLTTHITGTLGIGNGGTGLTSAGSDGSFLRSASSAFANSTLILPNAATANRVVYATSSNTWGESANLTFNGTTLSTVTVAASTSVTTPSITINGGTALTTYAENTWTPSVGGTATYTTQSGTYVKVGKLVFVSAQLNINTIGTGSTTTISGLPFQVAGGSQGGSGGVNYFSGLSTSVASLMVEAVAGTTTVALSFVAAGGATAASTTGVFTSGSRVFFSICYVAAS